MLLRFLNIIFSTAIRIRIVIYWGLVSVLGVICFDGIMLALKLKTISSRKLFHFLVLLLFIPGLYFDVIYFSGIPAPYGAALYAVCIRDAGIHKDEIV